MSQLTSCLGLQMIDSMVCISIITSTTHSKMRMMGRLKKLSQRHGNTTLLQPCLHQIMRAKHSHVLMSLHSKLHSRLLLVGPETTLHCLTGNCSALSQCKLVVDGENLKYDGCAPHGVLISSVCKLMMMDGCILYRQGLQGWVWDMFETTPKIPTYTVAFIVTDLAYIERNASTENGISYRVRN